MRPAQYRTLLLMIHGVNSTLEWSATALKVLDSHFRCRLIRYRYFHTLWGAVKVYIWPTALLLMLAYAILAVPHWWAWLFGESDEAWGWTGNLLSFRGGNAVALWLLAGLLVFEAWVVIKAEVQWPRAVGRKDSSWPVPLLFALTGLAGALLCRHPWQWALPSGALVGIAFFLDLREYSPRPLSWYTLVALPAVVMALVAWLVADVFARRSLLSAGLFVIGVGVIGVLEPFLRGNLAFARIRGEIEHARSEHPRPFVIAHSLGTYLTGHVLHEAVQFRLGRVLFTGCVLQRSYPWAGGSAPANRVLAVTNYVGRVDLVPLATGCLRELWCHLTRALRQRFPQFIDFLRRLTTWRPLGLAGFDGFTVNARVVHTQGVVAHCAACTTEKARAPVHNVPHDWAAHSTLNQSKSFQSWSWLPCLWGISPPEFGDWVEECQLGQFYAQPALNASGQRVHPYRPQDPDGLWRSQQRLANRRWCWPVAPEEPTPARGHKLKAYVALILKRIVHTAATVAAPTQFELFVKHVVDTDGTAALAERLMRRVPKFIIDAAAAAWEESQKPATDQDLEKLQRLHPQEALRHAVSLAVDEERKVAAASATDPHE
jgi:hypothetical protein